MWSKIIAAAGQLLAAVIAALVGRAEDRTDQRQLGADAVSRQTETVIGEMSDAVRSVDHAARDGARGVRDRLRAALDDAGSRRH